MQHFASNLQDTGAYLAHRRRVLAPNALCGLRRPGHETRSFIMKMRKLGTWASQLEIKAFVKVYQMDVRIHLDGTTHGHHDCIKASDDSAPREILHLAYVSLPSFLFLQVSSLCELPKWAVRR